jgi:hypothetical protein
MSLLRVSNPTHSTKSKNQYASRDPLKKGNRLL